MAEGFWCRPNKLPSAELTTPGWRPRGLWRLEPCRTLPGYRAAAGLRTRYPAPRRSSGPLLRSQVAAWTAHAPVPVTSPAVLRDCSTSWSWGGGRGAEERERAAPSPARPVTARVPAAPSAVPLPRILPARLPRWSRRRARGAGLPPFPRWARSPPLPLRPRQRCQRGAGRGWGGSARRGGGAHRGPRRLWTPLWRRSAGRTGAGLAGEGAGAPAGGGVLRRGGPWGASGPWRPCGWRGGGAAGRRPGSAAARGSVRRFPCALAAAVWRLRRGGLCRAAWVSSAPGSGRHRRSPRACPPPAPRPRRSAFLPVWNAVCSCVPGSRIYKKSE